MNGKVYADQYKNVMVNLAKYAAMMSYPNGYEYLADMGMDRNMMLESGFPEELLQTDERSAMYQQQLIARIKEILDKSFACKKVEEDYYVYEIYKAYDEELSDDTLQEIADTNPETGLEEHLSEMANDYWYNYGGQNELHSMVYDALSEEEQALFDSLDMDMWLETHVSCQYDSKQWRRNLKVNIVLDTGDANCDFTLNTDPNKDENGRLPEKASMLWLARQQGKEMEVQNACVSAYLNGDSNVPESDPFTKSMMQELDNTCSSLNALTFLVEMSSDDFLHIAMLIKNAKDNENASITLGRNTMCGLFDQWSGSGSLLEIQCDKDIEIPIKLIHALRIDGTIKYDVGEVYGMCGSAWKDTLIGITEEEEKRNE